MKLLVCKKVSLENKLRYFEQMKGKTQRLLIERIDAKGMARGYGENYIPIQLQSEGLEKNTFVEVTMDEVINPNNEDKMAFISSLPKKISKNNCLYQEKL